MWMHRRRIRKSDELYGEFEMRTCKMCKKEGDWDIRSLCNDCHFRTWTPIEV